MQTTPTPSTLTVHDLREAIGLLMTAMGNLLPPPIASALVDEINDLSRRTMDSGRTNVGMLGRDFAQALAATAGPGTKPGQH